MTDTVSSFSVNANGSIIGVSSGNSISTFAVDEGSLSAPLSVANFLPTGVKIFETLLDSDLVALVGTSLNGTDTLFIYDMALDKVTKSIECNGVPLSILLRAEYVTLVTDVAIYVYSLETMKLQSRVDNSSALSPPCCAWSSDRLHPVMCSSGLQRGTVRIERYGAATSSSSFVAHNSPLFRLGITPNGSFLASCSEKNSLIRVWSSFDHIKLYELRRDSSLAINEIFFSPSGHYMGAITQSNISFFKLSSLQSNETRGFGSGSSSPSTTTISDRISDALRELINKAGAEISVPLLVCRGVARAVFVHERLSVLCMLPHGVIMKFKLVSDLSKEPVLTKYIRVSPAEGSESGGFVVSEEAHSSEWVLLDEGVEDTQEENKSVPW